MFIRKGILRSLPFALLIASSSLSAMASETEAESAYPTTAVGLFLGATREHGSYEPTVGLEVGANMNANWSAGLVYEQSNTGSESGLLLAGVGWHPHQRVRLQLGVGKKDPWGERENVIRTGLTYEFELQDEWFIKPYFAYDFIEDAEDEPVVGFYFGKLF